MIRHVRWALALVLASVVCASVSAPVHAGEAESETMTALDHVLKETRPLAHTRGERPPLFLWTPNVPLDADDAQLEETLTALKARGIALYHRWGGTPEQTLKTYGRIGRLQKRLGMPVAVDATGIAHGFYSGDPQLSHVDEEGKPFRDGSFFWQPGCPFAVQKRIADKRDLAAAFAKSYRDADIQVDYWAADWEFDGPNEWKAGWEAARRCTRCQSEIADLDTDFEAFQQAVRRVRTAMQAEGLVTPVRAAFPDVRIGNYAMNPHDGYRYWWDFYEERAPGNPYVVEGVAYRKEHKALYRPWAREFEASGYNVAMPVLYTWFTIHDSYTFENRQFRWFRNMLLEASSVGANTPPETLIIPFVHWNTTNPPNPLPEGLEPMSETMYRELLWHALLRGADSFAMWSPEAETASEVRPVHEVYAAAQAFGEFLEQGVPVTFAVPTTPSPVVSALRLGRRLLVRRTDFTPTGEPTTLEVNGKAVSVPRTDGECVVLQMNENQPDTPVTGSATAE